MTEKTKILDFSSSLCRSMYLNWDLPLFITKANSLLNQKKFILQNLMKIITIMSLFEDYRAFFRAIRNDSLGHEFALSDLDLRIMYLRLCVIWAIIITSCLVSEQPQFPPYLLLSSINYSIITRAFIAFVCSATTLQMPIILRATYISLFNASKSMLMKQNFFFH